MLKAVELQNVTKQYGSKFIFKDFSMSIETGEMLALVGTSGCGKSTLLNMIGMLETYDSGEIQILGKKIPKIQSKKATLIRRNTINYLFQSFALISDMSVYQNLMLAMNFLDIAKKEKSRKIDEVLRQVNMLPLKDGIVNTLSGGEQQRVALARTILKPGSIVLADEPTGGA
jgi:putative ABC transport system ATP-binding protein